MTPRPILALGLLLAFGGQAALARGWRPPPGSAGVQTPIWPGSPPDDGLVTGPETVTTETQELVAGRPYVWVTGVSRPTLTLYRAKGRPTGAAVIVFPGGGYMGLAIDLEGSEVCDRLTAKGIACVLLKYRVPRSGGPYWDPACGCVLEPKAPMALEDAQRTIGLVRLHAAEWGVDPHKVGVIGFSAGGHLAAEVATHWDRRAYAPLDAADRESARPDFAAAIYPGHMTQKTTKPFELNPTLPVTRQTPPMFIVQAEDDPVDSVMNALVLYIALQKAGVPAEMHLYARGGHAFGLRRTERPITRWPVLFEAWLGAIGISR